MAQLDRKKMTVTVMDCEPRDKRSGSGQQLHLNLNPLGRAFCSDKQKALWPAIEQAHQDGSELTFDMMEGSLDRDGNPYWYVLGIEGAEQSEKAAPPGGGNGGAAPSTDRTALTPDQVCHLIRSLAIMGSAGWIMNIHDAYATLEDLAQTGVLKLRGIQIPEKPSADTKAS